MRTVNVISLGCSKNLVDTEALMRRLSDVGYTVVFDRRPGDESVGSGSIVVINTCGFIADAKEESINEILLWSKEREEGRISRLIVMGCLSERYRQELPEEIPSVDHWFGKTDWGKIVETLSTRTTSVKEYDRILTTPRHHAYLKIAEGCDRYCAFCAIPRITGHYRSRSMEDIIAEARLLASRGVVELNVIAQDLSHYGKDLPEGEATLARLIDSLADIPGIRRIRLHYAYPTDFPKDVLEVMRRRRNVCNYLDIALQHISDPVLKNMRRRITGEETRQLLKEIRAAVPDIHIRTTLMVGFPGEGEKEFEELLDFVREQQFERMGAFAYCEEEDTWAAEHLKDEIPEDVKQDRLARLMATQEEISMAIQKWKVGSLMPVIVDREEEQWYVGRTEYDSPEVDPEVLIRKDEKLEIGEIYKVRIDEALPFELIGHVEGYIPETTRRAVEKAIEMKIPFAVYSFPGKTDFHFIADPESTEHCGLWERGDTKWGGFFINFFANDEENITVVRNTMGEKEFLNAVDNRTLRSNEGPEEIELQRNAAVDKSNYLGQAYDLVQRIKHGLVDKVVLSRLIEGRTKDSVVATAIDYFTDLPETFRYICYTRRTGLWFGATPELLADYTPRTRVLKTVALAGTRRISEGGMWDRKNIEEHEMVIRYLCGRYIELGCTNLDEDMLELKEKQFGNIKHLLFDFEGKIGKHSEPHILCSLSPTPAVGGEPREAAIEEILTHELHDRYCYSGYVGVRTQRPAHVEAYVNLRCAMAAPHRPENEEDQTQWDYNIFVGGGLTSQSVPEKEWTETEYKAENLLNAITDHQ